MFGKFTFIAVMIFCLAGQTVAAGGETTVTILTQNMDAGTDLNYIIGAAAGLITVPQAVDLTFAELQASNLEQRAIRLADRIAADKPDIVALEEVMLWSTATGTTYDQLAFLLSALGALKTQYDVVAVNAVNDVTLPGAAVVALRMIERDVLLVRSGLRPPALHFSDVHSRLFDAALPFALPDLGRIDVRAGWISAMVHMGNKHFRLAMTHLQTKVALVPETVQIQEAQAQELLHALRNTTDPVVICGDFNSDANNNPAVPDFTPTADLIQEAGYADAWPLKHGGDPGNTWPLYLEDLIPAAFPVSDPVERIDLFFSRGMEVKAVERVVVPSSPGPPFASDHAGVTATFKP